jgi:hypothetical protein
LGSQILGTNKKNLGLFAPFFVVDPPKFVLYCCRAHKIERHFPSAAVKSHKKSGRGHISTGILREMMQPKWDILIKIYI